MSTTISFKKSEQNAIKNYQETIAKMNEFLGRIKDTLGSLTKSKIRFQKSIEYGNYGVLCDFYGGKLWLGFYQYDDNNEMQICISVEAITHDNPKFKQIDKALKDLNWKNYDDDNFGDKRTWYCHKDFSSFFTNDKFDTNLAHNFLETELLKIKKWL